MKKRKTARMGPLAVMLLGLTAMVTIGEERGAQPPARLGPDWRVGDSWKVRAEALQTQVAAEPSQQAQLKAPVDWKFTVSGTEEIKDRPCYRVMVVCLTPGRQQPVTTLWFDVKNRTLTRVEAKAFLKGQWRVFTETYVCEDGQACPVLGPIPALPLDFPVFAQEGETKDLTSQRYEVLYGEAGVKSVNDVGFAFSVDQSISPVKADYVKSLAPASEGEGVVEVEIRGARRRVSQLWQAGAPWPIYSNNGMAEARLVEVKRAGGIEEEQ